MRTFLALATALIAAAGAHAATPTPDGAILFINAFEQAVDLTVDGETIPAIQRMKVVGYPVKRGPHDLVLSTGAHTVNVTRSFDLENVAQDGKGRSYWCFVAATDPQVTVALKELEPADCAKMILALEMDNR